MKTKQMLEKEAKLPYEWAEQVLRYDSDTGKLFWKERDSSFFANWQHDGIAAAKSFNDMFAGKETFNIVSQKGYKRGKVFGTPYSAHRMAWLLTYGVWPEGEIDHINGDKIDNRIENLRDVTTEINNKNKLLVSSKNTSGYSGVSWVKSKKKWKAAIMVDKKKKFLGYFHDKEKANEAVLAARPQAGYTERHGT